MVEVVLVALALVAHGGSMDMMVSSSAASAVWAANKSVQMVRCVARACARRHDALLLPPPPPHLIVLFCEGG